MIVQLVANLAANGELILAEHSAAYAAPQEIAGMGFAKAMTCGNIVFLEKDLADELFFNLFPVVIHGGGALESVPQTTNAYKLADCSTNGDIAQLHYVKA